MTSPTRQISDNSRFPQPHLLHHKRQEVEAKSVILCPRKKKMFTKERTLWRVTEPSQNTANHLADCDGESERKALLDIFSTKYRQQSLWTLCCNSLVVGQEFSLVCLLLAGHRTAMLEQEQWRQAPSMMAISLALLIIIRCSETTTPSPKKMMIKVLDAILLTGILRLLSAIVKTLTPSYSSDTVQALAIAGLIVHLFLCDYSYANGLSCSVHVISEIDHGGRELFQVRNLSPNAVLFSTTLLASRIPSNSTVNVFVSSTVILFVFYPATRHTISKYSHAPYGTCRI